MRLVDDDVVDGGDHGGVGGGAGEPDEGLAVDVAVAGEHVEAHEEDAAEGVAWVVVATGGRSRSRSRAGSGSGSSSTRAKAATTTHSGLSKAARSFTTSAGSSGRPIRAAAAAASTREGSAVNARPRGGADGGLAVLVAVPDLRLGSNIARATRETRGGEVGLARRPVPLAPAPLRRRHNAVASARANAAIVSDGPRGDDGV